MNILAHNAFLALLAHCLVEPMKGKPAYRSASDAHVPIGIN